MVNQNSESAELNRLLQKAQKGDPQAFEQLFQFYRDTLEQTVALRMDRQLQNRIGVSDIIQDAHMVASRRFHDYLERKPVSFRVWLRQIVQDQLVMAYRKHVLVAGRTVRREIPLPEKSSAALAEQLITRGPTPSQQAVRKEQIRRVQMALEHLAVEDREILLLRDFEQLSYKEISYVLQIESAAARKRYGRALIRLGKLVRDMGLTESQL
jgi:RNA polymerase sigma-70 factor (ECF subfamily)